MRFRFTYSATGFADFVATDPGGWDQASIGFERDAKLLSLVEFFKSSFTAYGTNGQPVYYDILRNIDGARDHILAIEAANGCDSQITQLIEIDENDDDSWEYFFSSVLSVNELVESLNNSHLLQIVPSQADFWAKFIKRFNTPVDLKSVLDLDGNAVAATPSFTLPLPSQKIIKSYNAYLQFNKVFQINNISDLVFYVGFDVESVKEITDQSSLTLTLTQGANGSRPDAMDPKSYNTVIPFFNVTDDGEFVINKLQFTMSQGPQRDSAYAGGADYVNTTNDKNTKMTNVDFYLQVNTNAPIKLTKAYRAVGNFVRNDGVNETLIVGANDPFVTDYTLGVTSLTLRKTDAVKLFGIYNDEFTFPFRIDNGLVWMWGTDGWNHDSGYDQMRGGQGNYNKWRGAGSIHDDSNQGNFAWGGLFAPAGSFPTTIDDDGGTGLAIKASQWWNVPQGGFVVGGTVLVNAGQVIQAKVNNPTDSLADWYIWDKSPYEGLEAYGAGNGFEISFNTSFIDTNTEAFLTYDVIKGVIDRICGAPFKSDYFGNPYTSDVYGAVGCGANLANMLGLHLRGYLLADKPLQVSAQDWHDGINPMHCIGMGYEDVGGVTKIVCERAEHFFDDSNVSVDFLNIYDIKRSYDQDWQFNKLIFGNQKWESQAATGIGTPSGIDDPQSQRTWTDIFQFIGKELKQLSKLILASLTIESTRRIGINQSSNYTYDNDVFGIALYDNGGGDYVPETNENFSAVTNLLNSDTRYNNSHTPARFLLRWAKYWSGCLQDYVGSIIKYASGVGNFLMTSTKTTSCEGDETGDVVAENGDFVVGNDYLFIPTPIEINHKLDWTTYKYLRAHKNWAVTISQTRDVGVKAFIKSLEYFKAKGTIKMIVWPKTKFTIQNIESIATGEGIVPGIKYFQIPEFADEFE